MIRGKYRVADTKIFGEHGNESAHCDAACESVRDTGQTLGPLTTVELAAGAVGAGLGVVLFATATGLVTRGEPSLAAEGAVWRVRGLF